MITVEGIGTASWLEIAWTITAIPGFILWFFSWTSSRQSYEAAKDLKNTNGRLLWARFSVRLTGLMLIIELTFVVIGVIAMTRIPNSDSTLISTLITGISLIGVSVLITLLAQQWRVVEEQILTLARARLSERLALERLQVELSARQVAQNTRDTDQNLRTFKQDERDRAANIRNEEK